MPIDFPGGQLLGAVLAGGRSRRFGSDKAQAMLDGKSLLDRAIEQLSRHVDQVVLCGRTADGILSLADRPTADMGPLGGLNAALHHAVQGGYAGVLTTGCDMPVFPAELAGALPGEGAAILHGQQLIGYWPASLAPVLDGYLAASEDRSILAWLARVKPRVITLAGPPLPNVNTPADLDALEKRWAAERAD